MAGQVGCLLLHPVPALLHGRSTRLLAGVPYHLGRGRRPTKARPQLLGHDLDSRSGAAVLGGPAPLLEPAHDHHAAALQERPRGVLGLVPPHDHGEERRLLIPPTADGHPEHGWGDPGLGVADLGLVGEVAKGCLTAASVMVLPSWDCLAGRSALPLEPGDGGRRGMPRDRQGQATEPTKSARLDQLPSAARLGWRVGWRYLRLGIGHASTVRPDPSTWAWRARRLLVGTAASLANPRFRRLVRGSVDSRDS
jgi:hypothetical protein